MISPTVLNIPHSTQDNPHGTHDSPHGTEHPPRYSRYPPTFIMISPHGTEHPPRYSRYPPTVLMISPTVLNTPHGIARTLYRVVLVFEVLVSTHPSKQGLPKCVIQSENNWAKAVMGNERNPQFKNQSCFTGTCTVTGPKSDGTPSMLQWLAPSTVEEEREQLQLGLYHSTIDNQDSCSKALCLKIHLKLVSRKTLRRMQPKAC